MKILIALLLACSITACEKETYTPVEKAPCLNTPDWVGKFGFGNMSPDQYYHIVIKPNGELEVRDRYNNIINKGMWTLTSNRFKGTLPSTDYPGDYSISALFDGKERLSNGTWGLGEECTGAGTWYVSKKE